MRATAAVLRHPETHLRLEAVEVAPPASREVLIDVVASGVCHSDVSVADWRSRAPRDVPIVLGHEGAGVVIGVGPDVRRVRPGDRVVACPAASCGDCRVCRAGRPWLCKSESLVRPPDALQPRVRSVASGGRAWPFIEMGSFSELMLVHESAVAPIGPMPFELAAVLACGASTGLGAAIRTAGVRPGQSVAVFGCGGVGLSIVQGARICGASEIVAVDSRSGALELAERLGATRSVNAAIHPRALEAVRGHGGVDHAFEAAGSDALTRLAVASLAPGGTATIVGVPDAGSDVAFSWVDARMDCTVRVCRLGSLDVAADVPAYVGFWESGALRLEEMIDPSEWSLEAVNGALDHVRLGRALGRVVVRVRK